jgi:hypothetical protein
MALPLIRRTGIPACLLISVGAGAVTHAQAPSRRLEYEVKAKFLYNFPIFIEWPPARFPQPAAPFRLCVVGPDPFGPILDVTMQGAAVGTHQIVVDRLRDDAAAASCHMVFVSTLEKARLAAVMKAVAGKGVLVVGESRRVLEHCGGIAFVLEGEFVRFDVNVPALDAQGLRASSKLLRVARDASTRFGDCGR